MLPEKPFYLIRHGESEANRDQITAGAGTDSPLTERGREQARTLGPLLHQLEIKPASVYHSTMRRAKETALILNGHLKLPATEHHDLREHFMGLWEGRPWSEIQPRLDNDEPPEGGETGAQFSQRIQSALTDILNTEKEIPMIVAHGGLFHAIGLLYEYGMTHVNNCHLHYFEPYPSFDTFPWRAWQFDIDGGSLVKRVAPFCLSHAMQKIS